MSCIPDTARTVEMYALYQTGKACAAVGAAFGITRQSVCDRFKRRGFKLRPPSSSKALPFIEFDGARYAPEKDGYFRKTTGDREMLHHAIWIKANKRITRGWVVRFVDGDRMNVTLDNLESLPKNEANRRMVIKPKPCLACGRLMGRRLTGNYPEGPAEYAQRKTCGTRCSGDWRRGRRRVARMGS